ncbi:MAG TPA: ATP-binding protein [Gaiellaceae bacterium]|nr:ATP-binding protein [Gaiellaceae bacterium]
MSPLRSVGARLSLALVAVVAAALAIVYAGLVPILERNLVDSKIDQLVPLGENLAADVPDDQRRWQIFADDSAPIVNARVMIVDPLLEATEPTVLPLADSQSTQSPQIFDPIAVRAAQTEKTESGRLERGGKPYAEAAIPLPQETVLVLRAPLEDTLANVALVRRRLVLAGAVALLLSLGLGYGAAYLFARRLRRLERAADRIASGRFDEPIVDRGGDEVGQLAAAFDRMRLRLAGLERARREFIANASHELRTPIFSLGGFLELLDDEELDDATRKEFLGTAREQVARLTKLATDLLDLSRLDAGRVQLDRERLDLGAVARTICREFEAVARSKRHPIETAFDGPADAVGDEQRTIQIGRILVENALLHTPPGTTVRIRAGRENGRAVLEVEDEGPGIAATDLATVFDRFYRVDGGVAAGSGLGLAIAKELAELMGGAIELESRPGSTVFRLALPPAA